MGIAFLGLGSNLGDRRSFLTEALKRIAALPQTKVLQISSFIETECQGGPPQGKYLNAAAKIETSLKPLVLLRSLQEIEIHLGRPIDHPLWGPRVIDLDLLSYDDQILETATLSLPHPRLHRRLFVLIPLTEVDPHWVHPQLKKTAKELAMSLSQGEIPLSSHARGSATE